MNSIQKEMKEKSKKVKTIFINVELEFINSQNLISPILKTNESN